MPLTLRQRNRLDAIHRIMDTAMDLFDERGYSDVTIEEIAAASGVSPRTFYRYFGTKEGLFTADPLAAVGLGSYSGQIDPGDLPGTLERLIARIGEGPGVSEGGRRTSWRGMRYVMEEPSVRAAVYGALDEEAERLTALLRDAGESPARARVIARSYLFGAYFGALEQWHLDGRSRPLGDYVRDGLAALADQTAGGRGQA
ncbi:TetR/AcrR family transcriptional regulator [Nonomuraea diastatica]|uniref:TetR/AcrR family transcriptional regulator n=1 Tax=Nonomuraea diastatica TaxID=1848329 RepID=A0A4R4WZD2_9ACTN|nr:TetR/AcrR family transcriptional regulator [Nonomuraea diastatica]TDD23226.1 TetR/AcrR family transcriptional regulator [Nonomuraea diastatica]